MTPAARDRVAIPVVLVYWLLLAGGLVVYGATRIADFPSVIPLWIGAVAGTLLGQSMALRDLRPWIAVLVIACAAGMGAQLVPADMSGPQLWQAFIPAALCGFWSLGDRSGLAAFWFPAVLWMLSILDRTDASLVPDGNGAVLLAGLAAGFFVFLRVRESRRVGLWRAVGTVPLAEATPVEVLRAPPGRQLARTAWGLAISAIAIAITGWLAPALWRIEPLRNEVEAQAVTEGLPCCPLDDVELESTRVREYFDLGRGHAERATRRSPTGCRVCTYGAATTYQHPPVAYVEARGVREGYGGRGDDDGAGPGPARARGARPIGPAGEPAQVRTDEPAQVRTDEPAQVRTDEPTTTAPATAASEPAGSAPVPAAPAPRPAPPVQPAPSTPAAPRTAMTPPRHEAAETRSPAPAIHAAPPAARPAAYARGTTTTGGPSLLGWLLVIATGALIAQLVAIALRPVRRLVTLRHLRRPFWDETVAQRVSNAWQLALIGLRDAGWRAGASEAPHELARRVEVDGMERCATVLERARHGIGIDAGDLAEMHDAADTAYRAARRPMSPIARAISWLRWPLA